jgi:hypothetical protein
MTLRPTVEGLVHDLTDVFAENAPNIAWQRASAFGDEAEALYCEAARLRALALAQQMRADLARETAELYAEAARQLEARPVARAR